MFIALRRRARQVDRRGTTAVEVAFILPVFFTLVCGLIQICHARMVQFVLDGACRTAARQGSAGGVTTATVAAKARQVIGSACDASKVTIEVKQASAFQGVDPPDTSAEYSALPNAELSTTESGDLFLIRATVPYNQIAIIPLPFCQNITLSSVTLMRRE